MVNNMTKKSAKVFIYLMKEFKHKDDVEAMKQQMTEVILNIIKVNSVRCFTEKQRFVVLKEAFDYVAEIIKDQKDPSFVFVVSTDDSNITVTYGVATNTFKYTIKGEKK